MPNRFVGIVFGLVLILILSSCSKYVTDGDGINTYYYENGNIESTYNGTFEKGNLTQGEVKFYYENGNIKQMQKGIFNGGELTQGEVKFYGEFGNLKQIHKGTFENNLLKGVAELTFYNENGNIKQTLKGTFENGKLEQGEKTTYDEFGDIRQIQKGTFDKGELTQGEVKFYGESGNLERIIKGIFGRRYLIQGEKISYNENMGIEEIVKGTFENELLKGQGEIKSYYENENLKQILKGNFEGGKLEGQAELILYNENENVKEKLKGNFENGRLINGEVKFYNNDGNIRQMHRGTFESNYLEQGEAIFYYENGKLKEIQKGIFNKTNLIKGDRIYYDKEGNRKQTQIGMEDIENKIKRSIVWVKYVVDGKNVDGSSFQRVGTGSGVIVENENDELKIYTNRHVVDCEFNDDGCFQRVSEDIQVRTQNGKLHDVDEVSLSNSDVDLAILTIELDDAENYGFSSYNDDFKVGDKVIAVGYPSYAKNVVEFSIGIGRILKIKDVLSQLSGDGFRTIESDAYTYFGSSGGGLFDEEGRLIGINTWLAGTKTSVAIDFNSVRQQDFTHCRSNSYYADGECWRYCDEDQVRGLENRKCYDICDDFYCNSKRLQVDSPVCPEGKILGNDGTCHFPCGSSNTYCSGSRSICFKNQCILCSSGRLWEDGTCR